MAKEAGRKKVIEKKNKQSYNQLISVKLVKHRVVQKKRSQFISPV